MPRAISECCVAEQSSLDNLVVRVQHAVRTCASCSVSLRRVHYPNALFLCSVSLRRVYSFCWLLLILVRVMRCILYSCILLAQPQQAQQ